MRDPTGRGVTKNTTRTEEELVNSGDEYCRSGVKVRLSMQCEDPIKYPCLRPFYGQEGELKKPGNEVVFVLWGIFLSVLPLSNSGVINMIKCAQEGTVLIFCNRSVRGFIVS